eukprot:TRINITY_DN30620_c0_g1_i1.p1 TRINITY_DN30620_c0_g1~~TRINITY_DN30620_c0_g1_i1.p1  ORF type:complete len:492 (-),score=88.47 TRINITY_DN30620_c0_g1_i1:208-1683(-)
MRRFCCRILSLATLIWLCFSEEAGRRLRQAEPTYCTATNGHAPPDGPQKHTLAGNSSTVHWGYFYDGLQPALVVKSGDEVFVEMLTHHAGDDYEKMIKGDPGMEDVFRWDSENGPNIETRGMTGKGDGVHIVTGPIYVCDAEPGDVLKVEILELKPRLNPEGKSFGSNAAAWWGFHQRIGFKTGKPGREVITIYEIQLDEDGRGVYAVPDYQFTWLEDAYRGPELSCVAPEGVIPRTVEGREFAWQNREYVYDGAPPFDGVPCTAGIQQWTGIYYPGLITTHPTGTEDYSIRGKFRIPVKIHPGIIGLAPAWNEPVNAIPPMVTGGNLDNHRINEGTTMYLPVQAQGALLSVGDAHAAQGDGELDGTGIELSANGLFKVTLLKKDDLEPKFQGLDYPLLETPESYVIHGFTYKDYLNELKDLSSTIFGLSNIDRAMNIAVENAIVFAMKAYNLTEDQAITAISNGADFGVTQVVDGNWGVHAVIPRANFEF